MARGSTLKLGHSFTVLAICARVILEQLPAITAVFVGSFAAVGGGLAAALLLGETPRIMQPGPPYAIAAVAGAVTYVALDSVNGGLASTACVVVVLVIRIVAERAGLRTTAIRPLD